MAKIEIENISKVFGRNPDRIVSLLNGAETKAEILAQHGHVVGLRNVSLKIDAGQIYVIMGLSGSGKSTLIRHFNRLVDPSAGSIRIDGQDILALSPTELRKLRQTKISMVFQSFGLMPHLTVLQNVGYGLEARGDSSQTREAIARKWIGKVGLSGYEDSYPTQLSGGMQQRVGLARGLATDPEILLMDEAFSALDPLIRNDMQKILLDLQGELHKTIIFITHDLDEALAIGNRIAILHDGIVVQEGNPDDIVLRPANDYVSRFIASVNRSRALHVGSIMQLTTEHARNDTNVSVHDTLEDALIRVVKITDPVTVLDTRGVPCGTVTAQDIALAISGQVGGNQ